MIRRVTVAVVVAALLLAGCSVGGTDKQWYKPGGEYTSAEFERDRKACTQNYQLDEGCLRQRGWTSLSSDASPPSKPPPAARPRY